VDNRSQAKRRAPSLIKVRPLRLLPFFSTVLVSLSLCACSLPPNQNTIDGEIPSPDKEFKAVVFHHCGAYGALGNDYLSISILPSDGQLGDSSGNIYNADIDAETSDKVWITWLGNRRLQILRDPKAHVYSETEYSCFTGMFHKDDFKIYYADYPKSSQPEHKKPLPAKKHGTLKQL